MSGRWLTAALLLALAGPAAVPAALRAQGTDSSALTAPRASTRGPCDTRGEVVGKRTATGAVFVAGNAALYEYFRRAWWSGERADHFRINWELHEEFRQMDKFGHAWGGYHLAQFGNALLRDGCVPPRKAVWLSAAYAAAFQLQIELWDATQKKYGFSPFDLAANTAGASYAVLQAYHPGLRRFKPTISYHRTAAERHPPPGTDLRPTVDYSGQTYWISTDVDALLPERARRVWPGIVRASVGHSITDFVDAETGATMFAKHKLLLTLDLDPEKLPGDNRIWKAVKHGASFYHFPAPAIQIAPTGRLISWYR